MNGPETDLEKVLANAIIEKNLKSLVLIEITKEGNNMTKTDSTLMERDADEHSVVFNWNAVLRCTVDRLLERGINVDDIVAEVRDTKQERQQKLDRRQVN